MTNWTQKRIRQLIEDKVEENLQLEYKGARALGRQNNKTFEITKDVSAMANSIGGTLIYGVSEYRESEKSHLPEKLEPIDRKQFSREWLEQILGTIQPRIEGLVINALDDQTRKGYGFYVIEIPPSSTAHQAKDLRYYKRLNFSVVPMEDYEVRDVMNRRKEPRIVLSFELHRYTPRDPMVMTSLLLDKKEDELDLDVVATNEGAVLARYIVAKIEIPTLLLHPDAIHRPPQLDVEKLPPTTAQTLTNQTQDRSTMGNVLSDVRYEPVLPELNLFLGSISLNLDALLTSQRGSTIAWKTHADNAAPVSEKILLGDIPIRDHREGH